MSGVSNRKFLYFNLYISNLSKTQSQVVGDGTWSALQATSADGQTSIRVQILSNNNNVYLYKSTTGATGYKCLGKLVNAEDIGTLYWSNIESIACTVNTWGYGKNTITLQPGTYIICAHASFEAGSSTGTVRINGIDCVEAWQSFGQSSTTRRVTVTCFYTLTQQTILNVGVWNSTNITALDCEVCAMKIK